MLSGVRVVLVVEMCMPIVVQLGFKQARESILVQVCMSVVWSAQTFACQ